VFKSICDNGDSAKLENVLTFNDDIITKQLSSVIRGKLSNNNQCQLPVEDAWELVKNSVKEATNSVLGPIAS
jgi:hypothetical protein